MKIKRLVIENFKSIERIELVEPNPLTVFVGPNGSGKSNIFEALEFVNIRRKLSEGVLSLFGGIEHLRRRQSPLAEFELDCDLTNFTTENGFFKTLTTKTDDGEYVVKYDSNHNVEYAHSDYQQFFLNFSRLFINNDKLVKLSLDDNQRLSLSARNLEKVLKRLLSKELLREEIFEWLELFVPGFKAVEIDDRNELHWFENSSPTYFTKDLISDGTYNILALLTAVYQSDDKPQFLCIEEPENGLHPQVAREFIDFFRIMCEERGHHIWLNIHSQSMASRVRPEEFVVVEKKQGATTARQFKKEDFSGMRVDEAWLTNALNGGIAW